MQQMWGVIGILNLLLDSPVISMILLENKLNYTTKHGDQSNGLAERIIQALEDMMQKFTPFGLDFKKKRLTHKW